MFKLLLTALLTLNLATAIADGGVSDFTTYLPIDPQTKALLDYLVDHPDHPKLLAEVPLELLRQEQPYEQSKIDGIDYIKTISIPCTNGDVALRLYAPLTERDSLPVLMYFHGGGWTLGSLNDYDDLCQSLAVQAECLVVSVDYHLAPEYPFPAPLLDCYESLKWVSANIAEYSGDATRIAVGGDSAGGNLAAAVTLVAREFGDVKLVHQLLMYPAVSCQIETLSYEFFKENFFVTREDMKFFWNNYVQTQNGHNFYISPLRALHLNSLPRATIVIADYDVLRDEGLAYAWRLKEGGVPTKVLKYGSIHGFIKFHSLDIGKKAVVDLAADLKNSLYSERISGLNTDNEDVVK